MSGAAPLSCGAFSMVHGGLNWPTSSECGAVAQLGERCNRTAEVTGSIPVSSIEGRGVTLLP